ncbi:MAG: GIY-YIG nuclease family protein [Candidatus Liptonbacteria bacterium]|nr:GIY-YIG nuclease family protein [Candidatus Liptonbacteria bacterium]
MYYVYIIKSKAYPRIYIGSTPHPVQRLNDHNNGKSLATKRYLPWKIVFLEGYANKADALDREKKLKQFGKVYSQLKRRIWRSLQS